ncbi:MAG: membrane-associated Zn-dependent protease [Firmicutes bacterium]|nr:membrane-associated Zn-dependent protease [Bacillota bacterium]
MTYLLVLILIGFVVLVHEAGHFAVARAVGIPIKTFSVGFGPRLWSITRGGTEYRLSWIPLGGYVLPQIEDEDEFFRLPVNGRILMSLGGPAANILLTIMLFGLINTSAAGFSLAGAFIQPLSQTYHLLYQMVASLPSLFTQTEQLSGVIGIVAQGSQIVQSNSAFNSMWFTAFMSLNLAVLNLLPIPALDGGKVLLYLLEKLNPRLLKLHLPLALAGWVFIIGLTIYVTAQDIFKYFA